MAKDTVLVLNRDFTLTSTKGHSIFFQKGKPTHVPPALIAEALAIGAQTADGEAIIEEERKPGDAPTDANEREAAILKSFTTLVARNERSDFTAAGAPTVGAVSAAVGFKVQGSELGPIWQKYHEQQAALKG